jgi:peptidoglycan-associated lipoprotein
MRRLISVLAGLALTVGMLGCGGPKRKPELYRTGGSGARPTPGTGTTEPGDVGPDVNPIGGESYSASDLSAGGGPEGSPLADIFFEFDSAALTDAGRAVLDQHARWLQTRSGVRVSIEGHCDERGTVEYNLALGEQRAQTARQYLTSLGVEGARLNVVSYGKERPLDTGHGEDAWAKNRRAHFAIAR